MSIQAVMPERAPLLDDAFCREPDEDPMEGVRRVDWTVEAFYKAIQAGIFENPQRLELIHGEVIEKLSPQSTPHRAAVLRCEKIAEEAFGDGYYVQTQMPVDIGRPSEPEPDVAVIRGRVEDHDNSKPSSAEIALIIEVSDTTLGYDRHKKAASYAQAGIGDYWVLSLSGRWLEVRRDPAEMPDSRYGWGYKSVLRLSESETVSPLNAAAKSITVSDLLPRAEVNAD